MNLLEARKAVGATRPVRAVTDWPPIGHTLAAVACARPFTTPARFVLSEVTHKREPRRYVLRDSGVAVHIRHGTSDVAIVEEIFVDRVYEPPAHIGELLDGLGRNLRIADLGANIGLFGAFALGRWPGAKLVGFEPDPANLEVHRLTLATSGTRSEWRLVEAAATNVDCELDFAQGRFAASAIVAEHPSDSPDIRTVHGVDAFAWLQESDLVKVDIEGGEWALLCDPRLAELPAPVLVVEYHAHLCPGAEPREVAIDALQRAGYQTSDARLRGAPHGQGMLWAWRTEPYRSRTPTAFETPAANG